MEGCTVRLTMMEYLTKLQTLENGDVYCEVDDGLPHEAAVAREWGVYCEVDYDGVAYRSCSH